MNLSACGIDCSQCEFFDKQCQGCQNVSGKTFWAIEHLPGKVCPLFDCSVNQLQLKNCGQCEKLPCETWYQMKDPSWSEEEHLQSIKLRINNLKS